MVRVYDGSSVTTVPPGTGLTFAIDETLGRRRGKKIRIRGHYRDPLASSKERSVSASGIRWIVLALIVTPPWSARPWALPILSLPAPTPKVNAKAGRRHKTVSEHARQMIACLRRWLPGIDLTIVGDTAYSVIELGLSCRRRDVRLIAPLRLDARLFTPAPAKVPGQVGRPRVAGVRLPNLDVVLAGPETAWAAVAVRWYDGAEKPLEVASGTAVWYHSGMEPLSIRWVLTRDPAGQLGPRAYFSTRPEGEAAEVAGEVVKRWPIEVTFEEVRPLRGGPLGQEGEPMHEWQNLSHVRWDCKYHVAIMPKYRRKVFPGKLRRQVGVILRELCRQRGIDLVEGHAMPDHVHLCLGIPPKYSMAHAIGLLKGKSAAWIHRELLRERGMTGLHFWAAGYCVSTVGLDEARVRQDIREQEELGRRQGGFDFD